MNKAFFLDRDGTLNVDYDYVHLPSQWTWCEQAVESIRWMNHNGWLTIVVTNQSGVMRGKYGMKEVQDLHRWVDSELAKEGAHIDRWYVAPFHPEYHDGLDPNLLHFRKPGTGMFELASRELGIDYSRSVMVGDKISDLEPSVHLGIKSYFVKSVHEQKQDFNWLQSHKIPILDHLGQVIDIVRAQTHGNKMPQIR
jgi:D-glycero-D-manno-heptose 1,7-bisphosphate phosphatase